MLEIQTKERNTFREVTQTKKICVTIRSLANGGAEKQSLMLVRALRERYDTHLVVVSPEPQHPKHLSYINEQQLKHHFLRGNAFTRIRAFTRFLKENEIDIIFSFLPGDTLFSAVAGWLAKVDYIVGGIRNAKMAPHKKFTLRYLHNHLLHYSVSNCRSGKDFFAGQGFKRDKILVVPNGLDLDSDLIVRPKKSRLIIVTIGRFVDQKDYHSAVESIACLLKKYCPELPFIYRIIGYGEQEQEIRNWIRTYDLEELVELHINPGNIGDLLQESDVYLCTSIFEGLSNAILEAMSCSMPIVATAVGDNDLLVKNKVNGFLVPPKEPEKTAHRLYELLQSYEKRIDFGLKSYEMVKTRYSYESFQRQYFDIIENL